VPFNRVKVSINLLDSCIYFRKFKTLIHTQYGAKTFHFSLSDKNFGLFLLKEWERLELFLAEGYFIRFPNPEIKDSNLESTNPGLQDSSLTSPMTSLVVNNIYLTRANTLS